MWLGRVLEWHAAGVAAAAAAGLRFGPVITTLSQYPSSSCMLL
jgi:hypothetical protein